MKTARLAFLLSSISLFFGSAHAQDLNIGHTAPAIDVIRWVKGDTVSHFDKGQTYVVEFWATWCGPCRKSIPHLTELAHKYAGKIKFIGVDVFDQNSEPTDLSYVKKVKAFVDGQKQNMDYRVAVDGTGNSMANNWLKPYGEGYIPCAFVIDGNGMVAWIGNPEGLDEVLPQVLAPGYDLAKAAQTRLDAKRLEEAQLPLPRRFYEEVRKKNWAVAEQLSEQLLVTDPTAEKTYGATRFTVLLHTNPTDAYEYARKLSDGPYKGFAPALTGLARSIVQEGIDHPDLNLALKLAEASVEASHAKDCRYLETLAIVRFSRGEKEKAIEAEKAALQAGEVANEAPGFLKEMRDRLSGYSAS